MLARYYPTGQRACRLYNLYSPRVSDESSETQGTRPILMKI